MEEIKRIVNNVWQAWKRTAQFIGDQIARVILSLFYFTVFMPFALGLRIFGDPLALRSSHNAKWVDRRTHDLTIDDSRRLF